MKYLVTRFFSKFGDWEERVQMGRQAPCEYLRWRFCNDSKMVKVLHLRCFQGPWLRLGV